jgi:hypothetical protein
MSAAVALLQLFCLLLALFCQPDQGIPLVFGGRPRSHSPILRGAREKLSGREILKQQWNLLQQGRRHV